MSDLLNENILKCNSAQYIQDCNIHCRFTYILFAAHG